MAGEKGQARLSLHKTGPRPRMPCGAHQGKPTWEGGAEPWNQGRSTGKRLQGAQALSSGTMALGDPLMSQKRHTAPKVTPGLPAGARSSPPR